MEPNLKSHLKAKLLLNPAKSQIFLISLLLLSFFLTSLGVFFLWHSKLIGLLPFFAGLILVAVSIAGWFVSQKSIDLDKSIPTTVFKDKDTVQISTDSRSLNSKQATQCLINLIQTVHAREELPYPDGVVAKNGSICTDQESLQKAREITNNINQQVNDINNIAITGLKSEFLVRDNDKKIDEIMAEGALLNKSIEDNK
ncbi:hypothetical protein ACIH2S_11125 [Providencia sp. PAZ2]|uniref:hypothetical protein n=1 Tax=Providencia lanzhouensis TaxID=3378099 RepID=UPI003D28E5D1